MPKSFVFWLIYIIALIFSVGWNWPRPAARPFWPNALVFFTLIGLVGWAVFGAIVR